jgi:hypothetical protein
MNRRDFLSLSLLAPVAGVMAARDAMAAPALRDSISHAFGSFEFVDGPAGEFIAHEQIFEWPPRLLPINQARFIAEMGSLPPAEIWSRPAEDESVSAQFESDLAFLRDEPGVVS